MRRQRTLGYGMRAAVGIALLVVGAIGSRAIDHAPRAEAQGQRRSIVADELIIEGSDGTMRARLGTTEAGHIGLAMAGTDGKPRLLLAVESNQPAVRLYDANGQTRATLESADNGQSELALIDPNGMTRVSVRLRAEGHAAILVTDPSSYRGAIMGQTPDGWMEFAISIDGGKTSVAELSVSPDGRSHLRQDGVER